MKKVIKVLVSIITTILSIVILSVLGLIIYTEINKEDKFAADLIQIGYEKVTEFLFGKQEVKEEKPKDLGSIITNPEEITKYYFYEQLEDYSKIIYNKLLENKENMKTGTYTINFGESFSVLLEQPNGSDLLQDYYQSAIETYLYDNPDVFYLNPKKMYINIQTTKSKFKTKYEVYLNSGNEANYLADGYTTKEEVEIAEQKIQEIKNQIISSIENKSEYEKIKYIHDYLVEQIEYDETLSKNNIYDIYGALVNKECVCEGYAKSFKYLLDEARIENVIVIGKGTNSDGQTESHAWNYVKLEEAWYAVDVTWDDPIVKGFVGYVAQKLKYKYFLLGSKDISKDHIPRTQFVEGGKEYTYPILNENNYID